MVKDALQNFEGERGDDHTKIFQALAFRNIPFINKASFTSK